MRAKESPQAFEEQLILTVVRQYEDEMSDTLPTPRKSGWPKGVSGNPAGRPPGAKHRLAEKLIFDLTDFYSSHSQELLQKCFEESPIGFLQTLVKLLPKEVVSRFVIDSFSQTSIHLDTNQRQRIAESWIMSGESAKEEALPGVMEVHTKQVAALEKLARKAK